MSRVSSATSILPILAPATRSRLPAVGGEDVPVPVDLVLPLDAEVEGERVIKMERRPCTEPDHLVSGNGELHDLGNGTGGIRAGCEDARDGRVRDVFGENFAASTALSFPNHRCVRTDAMTSPHVEGPSIHPPTSPGSLARKGL